MQKTGRATADRRVRLGRHAPRPPRRRRQGDGPRQVRRRPRHAGPAGRQGAAQPAPARPHPRHRYERRRGAARREGRRHRAPTSPTSPRRSIVAGEQTVDYRDMVRNVMAREKVLYEGHAVAAVAATSAAIAKQALKLIKVDYEPLPHVIDVVEAMQPGAPLLHETMITAGVEPPPRRPSNVAKRVEIGHGDVEAGLHAGRRHRRAHLHHPGRCTRATSSRTPSWPASPRTARPTYG